ncbi:lipopolysaccharide kinase InaA family protein [Litchfieldella xinjiangensis]|uniref:lipopolysaccharide kinase InaA family protein n=1 Tax=Litchfieldella xinjiangensis TaxID=1166948 RepID=UPI0005B853D6|nr:lipopolysaccharide kinase InaA family protein [Halomonas xinjiangensis]
MKLLDIPFNDRRRRYLIFHAERLPSQLRLASTTTTEEFEQHASSRFYVAESHPVLAKVVPDKFSKRKQPLKWLTRDYLEKRWLLQADAGKEYRSLQILHQAGLTTPACHGWGISLNPGNRNASLLLMEYLPEARPGGEYFDGLRERERLAFLDEFCRQVLQLARAGYVHRDLHYNNLLVTPHNALVWIDTHVRALPRSPAKQWDAIAGSLTVNKLRGEAYRDYAERVLREQWSA